MKKDWILRPSRCICGDDVKTRRADIVTDLTAMQQPTGAAACLRSVFTIVHRDIWLLLASLLWGWPCGRPRCPPLVSWHVACNGNRRTGRPTANRRRKISAEFSGRVWCLEQVFRRTLRKTAQFIAQSMSIVPVVGRVVMLVSGSIIRYCKGMFKATEMKWTNMKLNKMKYDVHVF